MHSTTVLINKSDGIGILTLNRPSVLNAMNLQLVGELGAAINDMEADEAIRVLIITGSGNRAFCAGADIHEMRELSVEDHTKSQKLRYSTQWKLATCSKPIIGALNGLCYGGGSVMATSLDFLVGCELTKFRFLAAAYGQLNATWTLPNLIGWPKAKELLYTGRVVTAEEAHRIGLLNHLVSTDKVLEKSMELANQIAANYPTSVQGTKALILEGLGRTLKEQWDAEHAAREQRFRGLSIEEGFKDFISKKGRK
jgi:enoyl-CoA hydratase/carnithine racemase